VVEHFLIVLNPYTQFVYQIALARDGSIFAAEVLGWGTEKLRPR
jgi:hypothetical protein